MDLREIAEALSHLGDKGSDAFIAWVWMKGMSNALVFSGLMVVVALAYRLLRKIQLAEYGDKAK